MRSNRPRPGAVALALTVLMAVTFAAPAGSSPGPGEDNPWLQRRVAALAPAGGEDENPQETLFAFSRNIESGVPILDMDLQITSDGVPVLMHDNTVNRTTNGTGRVDSMTFAQVHALDAAYWFAPDCAACHGLPVDDYVFRGVRTGDVAPPAGSSAEDFAVPSLEQVFERFPDAWFNIEIKENAGDVVALADATAALIEAHGLTDRVAIASFGGAGIERFRTVAPEVATSATLDEVTEFFLTNTPPENAQILDVPPTYDLGGTVIEVVTPEFVQRAHAAGLAVWVWMDSHSQQNAGFYASLLDAGVDGLNVSRPQVLMDLLNERGVAWDPNAEPPAPGPEPDVTPEPEPERPGEPGPDDEGRPGGPGATTPSAARPVAGTPTYTG